VLVRNCKFQSGYSAYLTDVKIFKISLFAQNTCYYFGVRGEDDRWAEEERSRWVLDVSRAVRLVTQSIFPPFRIACNPMKANAMTHSRLMAGYIVHHDDPVTASVLYCELHAHQGDAAKIVLYENELCQSPVAEIFITETTMCSEKIGINCSCFSVEEHQFSTRTLAERKLWLRAISNVRVKLQNRAPNPTEEEMSSFRTAIKEHLLSIRAALEGPGLQDGSTGGMHSATKPSSPSYPRSPRFQAMDPLIQRCHQRRPPYSAGWAARGILVADPAAGHPPGEQNGEPTYPAEVAASEKARRPESADDLGGIKLELSQASGKPRPPPASLDPGRPLPSREMPKPGDG